MDQVNKTDLLKDLTEFALSADFRALAERQDVFCPFEALRVARTEIRHSNFLAHVLDPLANHAFGETVARQVLDLLFSLSGDHALRLDLALTDIGRVEIYRELRNMDLVIHLPDIERPVTCILEIKVDSREHGDQLVRYEEAAAQMWPNSQRKLFFVSPTGLEASREDWISVGFANVASALEDALGHSAGNQQAQGMLRAYIDMIRRLYVPDDKMELLARKLWQKHGQALEYLVDQRPSAMRDISQAIQSPEMISGIVAEIHEATGVAIKLDSSSNTYLRFYVPAWASNPDIEHGDFTASRHLLVLEVECYGERIHIRIQIGRGSAEHRENLYNQIRSYEGLDFGNNKKLTGQWTRLASQTIRRVKDIDEVSEEEKHKLIATARAGIVSFAKRHLPAYDRAVRGV